MPLSADEIRAEAELLDEAERSVVQIRQATSIYPDMTIDDAYAVQAAWRELKLARGQRLVGHKIGLTSRAMQQAMNITTPDSGFLTDDMVFAPDTEIEASRFPDLKIEMELAFVLAHDLVGHDLTIDDVLDATDHVIAAIEMIAARSYRTDPVTGRTRTVIDTISDNAADAGIITGGASIDPLQVDLRWVGAMLTKNGVVEETGLAGGVLGHPANGIVWLARRYAEHKMVLEAGHTILAGSFTRPVAVQPGDHFLADYGPLGSFEMPFV